MFWILVLAVVGSSFLVSYLVKKYRSPYTLTYIFGLKGAGKSTYMVKLMIQDLLNGWTVYTNMSDIAIPGVRVISSQALMSTCPPPHSAVYIDEAGLVWDNRKFATMADGYVAYFKLQRKYKNKVVMNSQALDVDKKIRDVVDRMVLMTNFFGCIGFVRPIKRTLKVLEAQGNSESRIASNLTFEGLFKSSFFFMPKYWKYFDSFQAPSRSTSPFSVPVDGVLSKPTLRQQLSVLRGRFCKQ